MRLFITEDYNDMSGVAAEMIAWEIKVKPDLVIGLATGSTPIGVYERLAGMNCDKIIDFSEVRSFNLDEYIGLDEKHEESYHYYMHKNLFDHINIKPENIHIPNGTADDLDQECLKYEEMITQAGGIDIQVLGIGVNGHIGFNEPGTNINTRTHVVKLAKETIESNKRFFSSADDVPKSAITMGLGTIVKAKKIILLASGEKKAKAIKKTVKGYLTTNVPSTVLALHPDVTLVLDRRAASMLW